MTSVGAACKWIALIAAVHLTATFGLMGAFAGIRVPSAWAWVLQAIAWLSMALSLPLLWPLHDPAMSRAATIALAAANSVAAAACVWLVVVAVRPARKDSTEPRASDSRGGIGR